MNSKLTYIFSVCLNRDARQITTSFKDFKKYIMGCVVRFGAICTIKTHGGVLLLVKLHALSLNLTKSSTPPWVFFTFYIIQIVPNRVAHLIFIPRK